MTINPVRHSKSARAVALQCLNEMLWAGLGCPEPVPGGILAMLPVYSIPSNRLRAGQYHKSWRSGWRYFWVHELGDIGAVVDVARMKDGTAKLSHFSIGQSAVQIALTVEMATLRYETDTTEFRPRILSLGPLQMEAFWLNSQSRNEQDYFFGLMHSGKDGDFIQSVNKRIQNLQSSTVCDRQDSF